jgi:hypothetical protein
MKCCYVSVGKVQECGTRSAEWVSDLGFCKRVVEAFLFSFENEQLAVILGGRSALRPDA